MANFPKAMELDSWRIDKTNNSRTSKEREETTVESRTIQKSALWSPLPSTLYQVPPPKIPPTNSLSKIPTTQNKLKMWIRKKLTRDKSQALKLIKTERESRKRRLNLESSRIKQLKKRITREGPKMVRVRIRCSRRWGRYLGTAGTSYLMRWSDKRDIRSPWSYCRRSVT